MNYSDCKSILKLFKKISIINFLEGGFGSIQKFNYLLEYSFNENLKMRK